MKVIDNEGRVFGKINIIDLGVVILVLFMFVGAYWGYRVYNPPKNIILEKVDSGVFITGTEYAHIRKLREEIAIFTNKHPEYRKYFSGDYYQKKQCVQDFMDKYPHYQMYLDD